MKKRSMVARLAAVAIVVLVTATITVPAAAATAPGTGWTPDSASVFADTAPVDPVARDAFLATWTRRFKAASKDTPLAATAAERATYDRWSEAQRRELTVALINHWYATLPDFAAAMGGEGEWTNEQLAGMVYGSVFEPEKLKDSLKAPATPPGLPSLADGNRASDLTAANVDIAAKRAELLAPRPLPVPASNAAVAPLPRPKPLPVPAPDPMATLEEALQDLLGGGPGREPPPTPQSIIATALRTVGGLPGTVSYLVGGVVGVSLTYVPCWRGDSFTPFCGDATPIGVPTSVNADGDLATGDAAGNDLRFSFEPVNLLANPGGATAKLTVQQLGPTSFGDGAWVWWSLPKAGVDVMAGFDGRGLEAVPGMDNAGLQRTQSITVAIPNLLAAAAGSMRVTSSITHDGPSGTVLVPTFGVRAYDDVSPPYLDDTPYVRLQLENAPRNLASEVNVAWHKEQTDGGSQAVVDSVNAKVVAETRPRATAIFQAGYNRIVGVIDAMPTWATFTMVPAERRYSYAASDVIDRITVKGWLNDFSFSGELLHVPRSVNVTLEPRGLRYVANEPLWSATMTMVLPDATASGRPQALTASVQGVPASFSVMHDEEAGGGQTFTYDASSSIEKITVDYADSALPRAAHAEVVWLPRKLVVKANDGALSMTTDGGFVGTVSGWYREGVGNFPALPQGPHAVYQDFSPGRWASFNVQGLRAVSVVKGAGNKVTADLELSSPEPFNLLYYRPRFSASATISNIPAHVRMVLDGGVVTYDAFGERINKIDLRASDYAGLNLTGVVSGIPAKVNVDLTGGEVVYTASQPIDSISLSGTAVGYGFSVLAEVIPTTWSMRRSGSGFAFNGGGEGLGRLSGYLTNTGSAPVMHFANYGSVELEPGKTAVAFSMTKIEQVSIVPGETTKLDLRMGGGDNLYLHLTHTDGTNLAEVNGHINPLPRSMQASVGPTTNVTTNENISLRLEGSYGTAAALDNTPAVPTDHGLSIVDGRSGDDVAYRASLFLTGLPTSVTISPGLFSMTAFKPTVNYLAVNMLLDDTVPSAMLSLALGLTPDVANDLLFIADSWRGESAGALTFRLDTTIPLGELIVTASLGGVGGYLHVSNIPDDIRATVSDREGSIAFDWSTNSVIDRIFAGLHSEGSSVGFRSAVRLTDLPPVFNINLGRDPDGGGPLMSYDAHNTERRLDVLAAADGSLQSNGASVGAKLYFGITDLVPGTAAGVRKGTLRLTALGPIAEIIASVSAYYDQTFENSGIIGGGLISFPWWYKVRVNPSIDDLTLILRDVAAFSMRPGVTSKITGKYGEFYFGWGNLNMHLEADAIFDVLIDWPDPLGETQFGLFWLDKPIVADFDLDVLFEVYSNDFRPWIEHEGNLLCNYYFAIDSKPGRLGSDWNRVWLPDPAEYGGAFYVTPNPAGIMPTWLTDVITFVSTGVEFAVKERVC